MRLWSLHPHYLDPQGLVALWREALLAQAVLHGQTRGYRNHPQLDRFKAHPAPQDAIAAYLQAVHAEATARGYAFDAGKIPPGAPAAPISVTTGQLAHEWAHLMAKLRVRKPALHAQWEGSTPVKAHPLFLLRDGDVEAWERP